MPTARRNRDTTDTVYESEYATLLLSEDSYRRNPRGIAELADDGTIDPVAVTIWATSERRPRITPREAICVVAELAGRGRNDNEIGAHIGVTGHAITVMRGRNRIAAGQPRPGWDYDTTGSAWDDGAEPADLDVWDEAA